MNLAFAQLFGIDDGFAGISFSGRTDTAILREAVGVHGLDGDFPALLARFQAARPLKKSSVLARDQLSQ